VQKIDAFSHTLPRAYLARLERQLEQTMAPNQLAYYREGVFTFDPVLTDLDARWQAMDAIAPDGGYRQVQDRLPRPPFDYFRRCYVDAALFGAPHAVRCVLEFFGPRHVLFGTDMPLGPANAVEATIADLEAAGLSAEGLAAVYAGNAVRLLGLQTDDN
jgi:hypothetical protein